MTTISPIRKPQRFLILLLLLVTSISFAQPDAGGGLIETPEANRFEITFAGSTAIGPDDTWLWDNGFGFNFSLGDRYATTDIFRVGFEQLGYASTTLLSGDRSAISIAPMVQYEHRFGDSPIEGVAGIGIPFQFRFGADLNTKIGTAPFVRLGLDIRTSDSFAFGFIERISYNLSDAFIMSEHALPSGAMIFATGITAKYRF